MLSNHMWFIPDWGSKLSGPLSVASTTKFTSRTFLNYNLHTCGRVRYCDTTPTEHPRKSSNHEKSHRGVTDPVETNTMREQSPIWGSASRAEGEKSLKDWINP